MWVTTEAGSLSALQPGSTLYANPRHPGLPMARAMDQPSVQFPQFHADQHLQKTAREGQFGIVASFFKTELVAKPLLHRQKNGPIDYQFGFIPVGRGS